MRITNSIIQNNAIKAMQQNLKEVSDAHTRASTGNKFTSFADDPHAQSEIMRNSGALRALEQYGRNISDALARSTLEDSVLDQLGDLITRARQIAIEQSSATATQMTRNSAKAEIDHLLEFAVGLGNTKYADSYLFGGDRSDTSPLSGTAPYYVTTEAPSGNHSTEISKGRMMKTTHNASEVFLDTGLLETLKDLSDALADNDGDQIGSTIDRLISSHQSLQALVGDLGARINQLDTVAVSLDSLRITLNIFQSDLGGVDLEEAFTTLMARETTYQSAMLATSRVMGMTLTDYLR